MYWPSLLRLLVSMTYVSCILKDKKPMDLFSFGDHAPIDKEDSPINFGYKTSWLSVKTNDGNALAKVLDRQYTRNANWKNGLASRKDVFLTPPIGEWMLVHGMPIDADFTFVEEYNILEKLSLEFEECHFFCTQRVSEYYVWVKAIEGQIIRSYGYLGERGENTMVTGIPQGLENELHLINTFSKESENRGYLEDDSLVIPDEDLIMKIAEDWSVNPSTLEGRTDISGLGLLCKQYI